MFRKVNFLNSGEGLGTNTNGEGPLGSLFFDGTFLYGMTSIGGSNNLGTIFKIKTDGTGYVKLLDFADTSNGSTPEGSLISDGTFLYGMTQKGGTKGFGVIFKIKPDGSGYTKLFDFANASNGAYPYGDLLYDGTFLYGMTSVGGTNGFGVIFKIKPDGTAYSLLLNFTGNANGSYPHGSLISDSTYLYGMTNAGGGSNDDGVIFKINPDGTGFTLMHLFGSPSTDGNLPFGSLVSDGTFLYGMTENGGTSLFGIVFKIKPDGTGYTKLLDFTGTANGSNPWGSLLLNNGCLYGMTTDGGTNNRGVVFSFCNITTGIEKSVGTNEQVVIYPNPNNGIFNIEITNSQQLMDNNYIEVYNILGESVYKGLLMQAQGNNIIDLSTQSAGLYLYRIASAKGELVKSGKLVLEK